MESYVNYKHVCPSCVGVVSGGIVLYLFKNFFFELLCVINAIFIDETHSDKGILEFGIGRFLDGNVEIYSGTLVNLRTGLVPINGHGVWYFWFNERNKALFLATFSFYFNEVLLDFCKSWSFVSNDLIILTLIVSKVLFNNFCVQIENVFSLHRHWVVIIWSDSTIFHLLILEILWIDRQKILSCLVLVCALWLAHYI